MAARVYLAWTSAEVDPSTPGPWRELRSAMPGLTLIDSDQPLSRVYHELKWSLPGSSSLLVAPLHEIPKLAHCRPGTTAWLRARFA